MKKRFIVTLELESDFRLLSQIRKLGYWVHAGKLCINDPCMRVIQVQANLIKPAKKAKAKKRG